MKLVKILKNISCAPSIYAILSLIPENLRCPDLDVIRLWCKNINNHSFCILCVPLEIVEDLVEARLEKLFSRQPENVGCTLSAHFAVDVLSV